MNDLEKGFLLLSSQLGDPQRVPLTQPQLRRLGIRVRAAALSREDREMVPEDLVALGYSRQEAARILKLLEDREQLECYLAKAARSGCRPLTRITAGYPARVRQRLGEDSPGSLWAKGDLSLLDRPMVALVGSRDLRPDNTAFAREVGYQAAAQGYVLVSGNARGADRTAQNACLRAGGSVICVVADSLELYTPGERRLYLSEDSFNAEFSTPRALSRNRIIHCLGQITLIAQATLEKGGTWDGAVRNLRGRWSALFCFDDGSVAADALAAMGAWPIGRSSLTDISALAAEAGSLFSLI